MSVNIKLSPVLDRESFLMTNVYRSVDKGALFDVANRILSTENPDVLEYSGNIPERDKLFWYASELVTTQGTLRSKAVAVAEVPYMGEGGSSILAGDASLGDMGFLEDQTTWSITSLWLKNQLPSVITFDPLQLQPGPPRMRKYMVNGKVLFVPSTHCFVGNITSGALETTVMDIWNRRPVIRSNGFLYRLDLCTREEIEGIYFRNTFSNAKYPSGPIKSFYTHGVAAYLVRTVIDGAVRTIRLNYLAADVATESLVGGGNLSWSQRAGNIGWCLRPLSSGEASDLN